MCLFQLWFPWCVCPAVGLLGRMAVLFPVFKEIATLFSIVAILICIPTNSVREPFSPHPLQAFISCRFLDSSHSDWYEMVPHCGFDSHFCENEETQILLLSDSPRELVQNIFFNLTPNLWIQKLRGLYDLAGFLSCSSIAEHRG